MAIVPHTENLSHTSTEPFAGHRWPSRAHPGDLARTTRLQSVLTAPRGRRFSRPGATSARPRQAVPPMPETPQEREQRLLRQMAGNPKVAYRLEHGVLPHWMHVDRQQQEQAEKKARAAAYLPDEPAPVLPHGRHRAPRQWWAWPAVAVSAALLLGLQMSEAVGEGFIQTAGILP